jgi:putative chitinase
MNALQLQSVLQSCLPACRDPSGWTPLLVDGLRDMTPAGLAAFLAQVAVESNCLNRLVENLNYTPERLMQIWPTRFPSLAAASQCAGHPELLANRVYGGRLGNAPEASGDGYRYRGRGLLQITGRTGYREAEISLGLPLVQHPELLEQKPVALKSALAFWNRNKLSALCNTAGEFTTMTEKINGGHHGLPERIAYWQKLRTALGVA